MSYSLCAGVPAQIWPSAVVCGYFVHHVPDLVCHDQ